MNFLTKLFVVLHVVLTMLFVAATVVWVNRVENFQVSGKALEAKLASSQGQATAATADAETARSQAKAVSIQAAASIESMSQQLNAAQSDIRERDTQLATAQTNLSSADARLQAATAALQTAQKSVALLQEQISQTRTASDKMQQQNTELLTANSDLNSRLQIATRQLRNANEELEASRTEVADFRDRGGSPAGGTAVAGVAPAANTAQAINGVIRDQKNINGVNFATISVGSADNVTKGMVFNVIDRQSGNFLGYVTVDTVEPNESTGRVEGPKMSDIKPGNEVRTQL